MKPGHTHVPGDCRLAGEILARVGDKWSVLVVMMLGDGPRRFNEIKRMVGGISQRMLSLTLKGLERDGLVTRTVTPTIPPRVDYALTGLGRSLWEAVEGLGRWAQENALAIHEARERFDTAGGRAEGGTAAASTRTPAALHRVAERSAVGPRRRGGRARSLRVGLAAGASEPAPARVFSSQTRPSALPSRSPGTRAGRAAGCGGPGSRGTGRGSPDTGPDPAHWSGLIAIFRAL